MTPAEFDRRMSEFFDNPRLPVPMRPSRLRTALEMLAFAVSVWSLLVLCWFI